MTWHGLLFGCATGGLRGVAMDLERIRRSLGNCGLRDDEMTTYSAARRADFEAAFRRLIGAVQPGDGVVVYYAGHGIRLRDPGTRAWSYALAPVLAYEETMAGRFGYVLREELERWFWEITAITRNVTWIADCCHAAGVFRGERERGLPDAQVVFFAERSRAIEELSAYARDGEGNPDVVRVCASASDSGAFEDDASGGRMTAALASALARLGHQPVVCHDLGHRLLAEPVLKHQQTVIAGPVGRWWLTARPAATCAFTTAVLHSAGTLLAGGRLLDQRVGDRYAVLDAGQTAVATLRVKGVSAVQAATEREPADDTTRITVAATAVLRRAGEPRGTVALDAGDPLVARLAGALTAPNYVAPVGASAAPLVARVEVREGSLVVADAEGREVGAWPAAEAEGAVCGAIEGLARQAALRGLRPRPGEALACSVAREGGQIAVTNGSGRACFVTLFGLCPDGSIALLTRGQPDGESVPLGAPLRLSGSPLPVVAIVCSVRVDLRGWTFGSAAAHRGESTRSDDGARFAVHVLDP